MKPNRTSEGPAVEIAKLQSDKAALLKTLEHAERVFNTSKIDPLQAFVMIERMRFIIEKAGKEGEQHHRKGIE